MQPPARYATVLSISITSVCERKIRNVVEMKLVICVNVLTPAHYNPLASPFTSVKIIVFSSTPPLPPHTHSTRFYDFCRFMLPHFFTPRLRMKLLFMRQQIYHLHNAERCMLHVAFSDAQTFFPSLHFHIFIFFLLSFSISLYYFYHVHHKNVLQLRSAAAIMIKCTLTFPGKWKICKFFMRTKKFSK